MSEQQTVLEWMRACIRVGAPLLSINTSDPSAVVATLRTYTKKPVTPPMWQWDCAQGCLPLNIEADNYPTGIASKSPEDVLEWAYALPINGIVLIHWQAEFWNGPECRQHLANLRDHAKNGAQKNTIILLGRALTVPASLHSDFLTYEEPLPDSETLKKVAYIAQEATGAKTLTEAQAQDIIAACAGMTAFEAEQACFLSGSKSGINVEKVWQHKIELINSTPGLQCWQGGEDFSKVAGLGGIKGYITHVIKGRLPIRLVFWVDEIEKAIAGAESDSSGVAQDYLGTTLTHMQDSKAQACLLFGQPGTGKSLIAKATGAEAQCLVVRLDLGACKSSLVGESEARLRHALAVERAITGHTDSATLWLITCNSTSNLPPELRSRFQSEWFYDLPGEQERLSIWALYRKQYEIAQDDAYPDDTGWVGREIERCCRLAWQFGTSLTEAARYIVPGATAGREAIDKRRKDAHGRYLDAQTGAVFTMQHESTSRRMELDV